MDEGLRINKEGGMNGCKEGGTQDHEHQYVRRDGGDGGDVVGGEERWCRVGCCVLQG